MCKGGSILMSVEDIRLYFYGADLNAVNLRDFSGWVVKFDRVFRVGKKKSCRELLVIE